jgi:hypothetical protein
MTAVTDEKLQSGCVRSIGCRVKYFSDGAVAAGKPDIAGGILRRSQDGIVGWGPGRARPLAVVGRCAANRVNGVHLEEAWYDENQDDNDRGNDHECRKEQRTAIT